MKVFVQGYGCSANLAETEQIKGFVLDHGGQLVNAPQDADYIVVNSCAVKKKTELSLIRRLRIINQSKKKQARVIVSGCLPKVNPGIITGFDPRIVQTGAELQGVSEALGFERTAFSPEISHVRSKPLVSIIPIAKGCLSNCSFCGTKLARGALSSFSISQIESHFKQVIRQTPEIWLASQDNGCYGFDLKTNLPDLVRTLLSNDGEFRVRIGMMSPQYIERYYDEFVELFSDERLYRFLHLPVQSGNNRILSLMRRSYSVEQFESLVARLRKDLGDFSLATDVIVGFPTETHDEFLDSVRLVERLRPDTVNISRYALRPNTTAARLPQLSERTMSERSHHLARVCKNVFLEKNQSLLGQTQTALASEPAKFGGLVCRTNAYKPVIVLDAVPGAFVRVRVTEAFPLFLKGQLVENPLQRAAPVAAFSLPIV